MISLVVKIVTVPLVIFIALYASSELQYDAIWQSLLIIFILICSGLLLESFLLKRISLWLSVLLDFIASFLILYIISNLLEGAHVSLIGAIVLALILAFAEYFLHRFLIRKYN